MYSDSTVVMVAVMSDSPKGTPMTSKTTDQRDLLSSVYMYVVENWAVKAQEVANTTGLNVAQARTALNKLEGAGLLASEKVNAERELTYQSFYDIENDDARKVRRQARDAFNKAFPTSGSPARKGATGPRYTDAQIKKGIAARRAGKNNREVAEAAGVKSPQYFSKVVSKAHAEAGSKPRRVVKRSAKK